MQSPAVNGPSEGAQRRMSALGLEPPNGKLLRKFRDRLAISGESGFRVEHQRAHQQPNTTVQAQGRRADAHVEQ